MLRAFGRLILVPIAFLVAVAAAGAVLVTLGLERFTHLAHSRGSELAGAEAVTRFLEKGIVLIAGATLAPALFVIIIGEVARIRHALFYVVGGGLSLALLPVLAARGALDAAGVEFWPVLATAGFAGGLVYWLLAGRTA